MKTSLTHSVGKKIKDLRESKNISAEEIAERSGLDFKFYLSLEENKEIPTLGDLVKIARVLGVRLGTLLDDCCDEGPVVHKAQERKLKAVVRNGSCLEEADVSYYSLSDRKANRHMETYTLEIKSVAKENKKFSSHEGEEFLYVLDGEIELLYGKDSYFLGEGDSIYFDSIVPHHIGPASTEKIAKLLAVIYIPA